MENTSTEFTINEYNRGRGGNFCTFHQQPHSEKKCPQWLNTITLVMNKLLDSKLTKDSDKEEEKIRS